ncbi:hypothetical protein [Aerosakkonema funiforme]|uniref:Uncharacterized protein n=1 Tax=Aerosakkonema funiforme FACHB-1375 TaxID=2949571 RepID=A0A926VDZ0_9CYAN|nr:hypothetical protein [Aerosakkonema funiforme]MBD2182110.1 hypothetical protein [Aerosakkonema funiforme FACHB-1375]
MKKAKELTMPTKGEKFNLESGEILLVGTATVLLRYTGFPILTDPK